MTSPSKLAANQPPQFYRGGAAIAALRGAADGKEFGPEDWVASTTTLFGQEETGLSRLPDGRWLRDAVRADPESWLGAKHVAAFAGSTALLVKLLDAGQRLPVHFHPSNSFARKHFDSHFGKTEAWIVVGTSGDDPRVYPGFRESVDPATVGEWVREQDGAAMLGALNSVPVKPGDNVYIPSGLPHAIGAGVFVVELQQPTDFSLTIEWRDFLQSPEKGHLGLGFDTALQALDTSARDPESIITRTGATDESIVELLVPGAAEFFRADRLHPKPSLALDPSFTVLVMLDGQGTLKTEHGGDLALAKGDTVVVPYAAGQAELSGELTTIRCRPPAPGA
ncbi:class I mannose-6-phosphate isomerase [Amycolatopsis acidiphila]|uniref:Phosphohexomutase n=1 Tax=Amycolatopsis acidiphila TaxID=715473 RepID=A0A557ZXY4_9PSEU|nr:class I mannose-6-phosphate isomerase [Amycolatopsis acidiphila]TVT16862.1 mannose-6-phosphate isomerase [Amycolatopsis acidiphila]UIJ58709.1 class I mannose-6-phosphate isomerase [Amycolatopsis acidiphila]GHG75911.1 mannose-6-phosphate isomerase [Amycolatopsis acidiphila]